jgi:hypothetical protein
MIQSNDDPLGQSICRWLVPKKRSLRLFSPRHSCDFVVHIDQSHPEGSRRVWVVEMAVSSISGAFLRRRHVWPPSTLIPLNGMLWLLAEHVAL